VPVEITAADRDRIIRDTAKAGRPAPSWVAADPKLQAIYDAAAPTPPGTISPKKPAASAPAPKNPAASPSRSGGAAGTPAARAPRSGARGGRRKGSGRGGASSPRPAGPVPLPRVLSRAAGGSAAGGLFLAVFLYPIALAVFQHGGAGFGMWLKAKFLNQPADQHLGTDGKPLTKRQGPIVPKTGPGSPGYTPPATGSVNQSGVAGQTAPAATVFTDSWAQMMKTRERVMQ
jgi:hypothetical protein